MILLVCGSRHWSDTTKLNTVLNEYTPDIVIEGGASGADTLARLHFQSRGIHVATVNALWKYYQGNAGPERNAAMITLKPDLVIAFWLGGSSGTRNMITQADQYNIPTCIVIA